MFVELFRPNGTSITYRDAENVVSVPGYIAFDSEAYGHVRFSGTYRVKEQVPANNEGTTTATT